MIKLILELLKMMIGIIIFSSVFIVGIIYTLVKHIYQLNYKLSIQLTPIVRSITLSFDDLACASSGEMINDVLRIEGKIKYGKWYQTISAITGLVNIYEKDTSLRKILDKTLGKNHCILAITEQDHYYYKNQILNE